MRGSDNSLALARRLLQRTCFWLQGHEDKSIWQSQLAGCVRSVKNIARELHAKNVGLSEFANMC